jgi:ribonuclease E
MVKKMLIDATHAEETRVVVVDGNKVEEFDFESENKRQIAGNIYLAKVTRVEPSLQAAFVEYGGNRHGFLAFSEIHPDYYQIPVADREALMEEERAYAQSQNDEEDEEPAKKTRSRRGRGRGRSSGKPQAAPAAEIVSDVSGMETIDFDDDAAEVEITTDASPLLDVAEVAVATENAAEVATESEQTTVASDAVVDPAVVAPDDASPDADVEPAGAADSNETDDTPPTTMAAEVDSDDPEISSDIIADDASDDDDANDDDQDSDTDDSAAHDDGIESVADDDDALDLRPKRAPRPRRYKIQEVIKVRQIMLVQVVKEERGNKGAALTTYLSLAGRYCVLMPNTARGGGISRKITNAVDRKKLKEIANSIDVPNGAGLIVRTAGAKRTKTEIKRDYEYLQRLWEQIRELTLKSIAPAKIYEEGDLIKRSIRDLYNRDIEEVLVEGERGYRNAKDFMKMIMPSHAKNVRHYQDAMPLFARYQVESYLSSMFNPVVQLKSGGYLVIGVTEALVAIDVNSGRATKEGSIEETALKTNLEAAEEVARQLRLRDLAGLIVIDFIDMDERRNNAAVEKRIKDKLKTDRARIQVGRISGFGLMEMSRQRLRPGMIEATTQACAHCHGTGLIRSDDNLALSILRQIEEEGVRRRSREVLVQCPVGIANFIMNQKRDHVAHIETRYGLSVRVEGDPAMVSPDFTIEKFKTATRIVAEVAPVVSADTIVMDQVDELLDEVEDAEIVTDEAEEERKPKKRRRRRRRRKGGGTDENGSDTASDDTASDDTVNTETHADEQQVETPPEAAESAPEAPKKRTRRSRKPAAAAVDVTVSDQDTGESSNDAAPAEQDVTEQSATKSEAEAAPVKRPRRTRKKKVAEEVAPEGTTAEATVPVSDTPDAQADTETELAEKPKRKRAPRKTKAQKEAELQAATEQPVGDLNDTVTGDQTSAQPANDAVVEPVIEQAVEPDVATPAKVDAQDEPQHTPAAKSDAPAEPAKPKRRGWWSLGR